LIPIKIVMKVDARVLEGCAFSAKLSRRNKIYL